MRDDRADPGAGELSRRAFRGDRCAGLARTLHPADRIAALDGGVLGGFVLWAVADRMSVNRRNPPPPPGLPPGALNDAIAVVGGLGVQAAFVLWLHEWLIGMPPVAL